MNELMRQLNRTYEKIREENLRTHEARKRLIYERIPRIKAIDIEMASFGREIARAVSENPKQAVQAAQQIANIAMKLKEEKEMLLESNNYGSRFLDLIYNCKNCEDTGYTKENKRCECYNKKLSDLAYNQSDLRSKLIRENFNTFNLELFSKNVHPELGLSSKENMENIAELSLSFVAHFDHKNNDNLLFYGNTGLGKTFMCSCIAKELIDKNKSVIYQTAYNLIDVIQNHKFGETNKDKHNMTYRLLFSCDLLIIDDLGTEFINTFTQTEIFNIINMRLLQQKKTIISTNLSPMELGEQYGERITSRFFGHYQMLKFIGEDLRLK